MSQGMSQELFTSDIALLDLLRRQESMTVADLAKALEVTATAVRQRLNRLMAQGYIDRITDRAGRGRPSHRYRLTSRGRRKTGSNFADLAVVLWQEVRAIEDPEVRRGLLARLARRMAEQYADRLPGHTIEEKMESLVELFAERRVPMSVSTEEEGLPVLTAEACPYPDLAEQDRSICAMERMLFSQMLGADLHLTKCRLDEGNCCTFEMN